MNFSQKTIFFCRDTAPARAAALPLICGMLPGFSAPIQFGLYRPDAPQFAPEDGRTARIARRLSWNCSLLRRHMLQALRPVCACSAAATLKLRFGPETAQPAT